MQVLSQLASLGIPALISFVLSVFFTTWVDPQTTGGIALLFITSFSIILLISLIIQSFFSKKADFEEKSTKNHDKTTVNINTVSAKNRKIKK